MKLARSRTRRAVEVGVKSCCGSRLGLVEIARADALVRAEIDSARLAGRGMRDCGVTQRAPLTALGVAGVEASGGARLEGLRDSAGCLSCVLACNEPSAVREGVSCLLDTRLEAGTGPTSGAFGAGEGCKTAAD